MHLIIGLGNPGHEYERTRHNIGFLVIDELSNSFSIPLKKTKFDAVFGKGLIENKEVLLAKPISFMNRSGYPVFGLANYFTISSEDILVIHDDIDLALGIIKIKEKGGHGGHRGIKSLIDVLGSNDFIRLRIGINRPESDKITVSNYVLGNFNNVESKSLSLILDKAKDAAVTILCKGAKDAMNNFNNKNFLTSN
ncbi:MAG: aminoacyl-tRNA hydrolase [Desulfobacterales bacterium]|nr:aminoacyl-tRNA hydrolase [Desulfobacterales bacterium]